MLIHFNINTQRDLLVPDFACYQMNLMGPVNAAIAAGEVAEDFKMLPSWAKFAANPIKSKGFFTRTLEAMFLGQGGHDEINVDLQTEDYKSQRVSMMFMPANTRNDVLKLIGTIAQETLPGFEVVVVCGSAKYNGRKITNRIAEQAVKEIVEQGKPTIIIAAQMAQRSFSIPQITELYLAYDRGENGATIQKMSRTLTPGTMEKVGRIFSLSFDPNRDDKFDAMVVETAINYKQRNNAKSLQEAMRDVLRTIDIFKCTEFGSVKVDVDEYLALAMERKAISRVLGKIVSLSGLSPEALAALANGNSDYFRNKEQDTTESGKTRDQQSNKNDNNEKRDLSTEKEIAKARQVITTILENLDIVILGTGNTILSDAMDTVQNDADMRECVEEEFGVAVETITYLFQNNIIKQDWVELLYDNA
tara:strand:+ start:638 stop:1894 length:1257 start_codon:yes stop_codon:yes gene_type:complete